MNAISNGNDSRQVRYLGKFDSLNPQIKEFNKWVRESIEDMNNAPDDPSLALNSEMEKDEVDLLRSHLSYQVGLKDEMTEAEDADSDGHDITGGTTFKVILRAQPNPGVEISGPKYIANNYKESLKKVIDEETKEDPNFSDIVDE